MPETEPIEVVDQPSQSDPAGTGSDQPPVPKPGWAQALASGKGMQRPRVSRSTGKTGNPTPRAQQGNTRPSVQPAPVAQVPQATPQQAQPQQATPPQAAQPTPAQAPAQVPTPEIAPAQQAAITTETTQTEPTGPRVLRAQTGDDMIEGIGSKPMTVSQLQKSFGKMQDQDRREGQLNYRQQQLDAQAQALTERERAFSTRPTQQFQPTPQQAPQQVVTENRAPARPAGAIEGDDTWADWQAKLVAFHVENKVREIIGPIADTVRQTQEERIAEQKAREEAGLRYQRNDQVFTRSLREDLPFDPLGLSQETYDKVIGEIRTKAMDLDPNYDFNDANKMSSFDLNPAITKAAIKLAFPAGTLPPGYAPTTTESNPMTQAALQVEKPIIPASPKKPLPNTIVDSVPARDVRGGAQGRIPGGGSNWVAKLRGTESLNPVTIRRSQGSG